MKSIKDLLNFATQMGTLYVIAFLFVLLIQWAG
jgi:hypothetical protein